MYKLLSSLSKQLKPEIIRGLKFLSEREELGADIRIELIRFFAEAAVRNGAYLELCVEILNKYFFS